jgi:hypothetical protein
MATWYYLMKVMKNTSINQRKFDSCEYFSPLPEYYAKSKAALTEISEHCRVCLQHGTMEVIGNESMTDVIEALKIFTEIQIDENDDKPKLLCSVCYKFVKIAIIFRKTAKKSDEILNKPLKVENFHESMDDSNHDDNDYSDEGDSESKPLDQWQGIDNNYEKIKKEQKDKIKCSPKVTCHVCNKVINRSYYKEHVTMHDPDHKKYVCDVCGKSFRLRCAYHNHSLRHRNDFPYKCSFCPYKGRYAELLKTHMRTHTGDYRYMCTECPARFLFKSNLNSHMLKHREPQFKCDTCKRAFHTALALQRHYEADHLGIKNHVCNICGKAFGYRNAMMKHQRHVHKREKLLFGRMPSYLEAEHRKPEGDM